MGACSLLGLVIVLVVSFCVHTSVSFQPALAPRVATCLDMSMSAADVHPAVEGWPNLYNYLGSPPGTGPRVIHQQFAVEKATPEMLYELDVQNWPTWTTSDKEKWTVGNQVFGKVMPYGELSYLLAGTLEIIPHETGVPVYIQAGDLVTFPQWFTADWRVLEEVTWHCYLY